MGELLPHQQRVVEEKEELLTRTRKLNDFIGYNPLFEHVDPVEQERLRLQLDIMWQLVEVLSARIEAFSGGN